MDMDKKGMEPAKHQSDGSSLPPEAQVGLEVMAAAARRRLAVERPEEVKRQPPEAILNLPLSSNPVTRYFAGRDTRPATGSDLLRKIRQSRNLLIEAGMDKRFAELPNESFPWHCVDEAIAQSFALLLERRYANFKSRENLLGVVRQMLRECTAVGLISYADRDLVLECLPVRSIRRPPAGRELSEYDIRRLLKVTMAGTRPIDQRDAAVIAIFLSTGLRASEVAEIKITDLDLDPSVRSVYVTRTKSGSSRVAWLSPFAFDVVQTWLAVRGDHPGALLDSQKCRGRCLNAVYINRLVQMRGRAAGIKEHFSSHDFRRTFATRALRSGIDVFTVQRLLDHKNVQTTLCYDRRTEVEDRAVVDGLELPGLTSRSVGR